MVEGPEIGLYYNNSSKKKTLFQNFYKKKDKYFKNKGISHIKREILFKFFEAKDNCKQ